MKNLPDSIDELKKMILTQGEEIKALKGFINRLRRKNFAPKSEVISKEQLGIFNEVETNSEVVGSKEESETPNKVSRNDGQGCLLRFQERPWLLIF